MLWGLGKIQTLTLCLGNIKFSCFMSCADFFSKSRFSKNSFRNIVNVSNSLDLDQTRRVVVSDLGPIRFQGFSADGTNMQRKPNDTQI